MEQNINTNSPNSYCPLFGEIAVAKGFITKEQLKEGLVEQIDEDINEKPHRLIAEILLERGWVTKRQVLEVLSELFKTAGKLHEPLAPHKKLEEQLYTMSITDELTGLFNRRGFFTVAEHRLKIAKRKKTDFLLLYADLNDLKGINEAYGHAEGDKLLKETANILTSTYRDADVVARIGGDEFVVFPVGTNKNHIETITSRLQKNIDIFNSRSNKSYTLSMNVGISVYDPQSVNSINGLLAEADKLMYLQKKQKK